MSSKVTPAKEASAADDFKVIKGIGPGVEQRLHAAGILSYVRLAALSPADIAALTSDITGLSTERIIKQGWVEQAQKLASGLPHPTGLPVAPSSVMREPVQEAPNLEATELEDPISRIVSRLEEPVQQTTGISFRLELGLDDLRRVTELRLVHEQSGAAESWKRWEQARLIEFIEKNAAIHFELPDKVQVQTASEATTLKPAGIPKLTSLEAISPLTERPIRLINAQQPFDLRLGIALSEVVFPEGTSLDYQVNIYAKQLGNPKPPRLLSELTGNVSSADEFSLRATVDGPEPGIYRLEATLILTAHAEQRDTDDNLKAMLEGSLLQVY